LNLILNVVGSQSQADLEFIVNEKARAYLMSLAQTPKQSWKRMYPNGDPRGLDLLDKLLAFNPNQRINVEDALAHPFFEQYYDPNGKF
jgi:mitogen-activated protein kinase 1/3